jgi:hypothetical protein
MEEAVEELVKVKPKRKVTPNNKLHNHHYRVKKTIKYQQWNAWTLGLEYTLLAAVTVRRDLTRAWCLKFGEDTINAQSFHVLSGIRMYCATTGFDKLDIRLFCNFMVANRIMPKTYIQKTYAYQMINVLAKHDFIVPVGYSKEFKHPRVYTMTNKAKMLFRDYEIALKAFFEDPLIVPKEMFGKRGKITFKAPEQP